MGKVIGHVRTHLLITFLAQKEGNMPLATNKLNRRSKKAAIQEAVSSAIETLMGEWKETGKMGTSHPATEEEARKQAAAIAYHSARSRAGGSKVPRK